VEEKRKERLAAFSPNSDSVLINALVDAALDAACRQRSARRFNPLFGI